MVCNNATAVRLLGCTRYEVPGTLFSTNVLYVGCVDFGYLVRVQYGSLPEHTEVAGKYSLHHQVLVLFYREKEVRIL